MLKLKKDVTLVKTDDDGTLVDAASGRYIGLNWSAVMMLSALMESETLDDAVQRVQAEVDIDPETARRDLSTLRQQLDELSLTEADADGQEPPCKA